MITDLIRVVIPAYNAEQYINASVESLLKQMYRNIEIIIVDDGSVYNTLKRCEELAQCMLEFDEQNYKNDVINFLETYGVYEDGHASERAAAFISNLIGEFT